MITNSFEKDILKRILNKCLEIILKQTNKKKEQQKGPDNLQKEISFIFMKLASVT